VETIASVGRERGPAARLDRIFEIFTYPKEGHGFSQHHHQVDASRKPLAFLNKYLRPEYGQSITSTEEMVLEKK
jgi:hypothetical protein